MDTIRCRLTFWYAVLFSALAVVLFLSEDRETVLQERRSYYSILVRLEVHFGNTRRRKYSDYY